MSLIIGISGISGAGKTVLVNNLAKELDITAIAWDDFDSISNGPCDYVDWYNRGEDYTEWDYPKLAETLSQLKSGKTVIHPALETRVIPTELIVFDAPLGRMHKQTGSYVDFWIHISVPLDIALVRRTIRDYKSDNKSKNELLLELESYIQATRPLFFDNDYINEADLVIDGMLSIDSQISKIIPVINSRNVKE